MARATGEPTLRRPGLFSFVFLAATFLSISPRAADTRVAALDEKIERTLALPQDFSRP